MPTKHRPNSKYILRKITRKKCSEENYHGKASKADDDELDPFTKDFKAMKEANAIRSSHIKQAARNESIGRASTGQNWKRSKCEDRDPDARRGSWTDICSKIRSANRTVAMLQVPAAKNSQLSKSQEIMNCPPSPRTQIKLQFGANQPESDLSQRIRKLSNGKRTKQISKNDSVSSGMGPRRRSSVF